MYKITLVLSDLSNVPYANYKVVFTSYPDHLPKHLFNAGSTRPFSTTGETMTAADGTVEVYVNDPGPYNLVVYNPISLAEVSRSTHFEPLSHTVQNVYPVPGNSGGGSGPGTSGASPTGSIDIGRVGVYRIA